MEKYELLYIIAAKFTDKEIEALMEKINGMVTSIGGKVTESMNLGRRKLAYPISHVRNGNYVLVHFDAEPAVMAKLNDVLRLSADILRHLITVKSPHLTKVPNFAELVEIRTEGEEAAAPQMRPRQMAPRAAAPKAAAGAPVTMEDLDKKLDQILTEEVK
jgi:small subunit ribosomal protein S6